MNYNSCQSNKRVYFFVMFICNSFNISSMIIITDLFLKIALFNLYNPIILSCTIFYSLSDITLLSTDRPQALVATTPLTQTRTKPSLLSTV